MRNLQESAFDAIPSSVFVVVENLSVRDFNDSSCELPDEVLLSTLRPADDGSKVGDLIGCTDAAQLGCGNAPACGSCGIVRAVQVAQRMCGPKKVFRTSTLVRIQRASESESIEFLTTATSFRHGDSPLVLLILENKANWAGILETEPLKAKSTAVGRFPFDLIPEADTPNS